ncbi:hypothetical protein AB434_0900 [Heyndrickxia coagulans]|uniref:Uncharacterized protein n=1 Tax=Heyndrickxia coagulans TaxID=1398 RepID=A0AAN0T3L9_HEYCO|nr:hypothetical protein SB48_HM08orf00397 [Heyndrickxia coagulans]AKN53305.1 hypothetical protein AB434_0900 [Heyndrickxia coagulans]KYC65998.1 hypothetical protein B4100_1627 [Heyndrickxia coagulans]KYC88565.1 hypothetical protein B4096_1570 [Heyndrickxia coagulans]
MCAKFAILICSVSSLLYGKTGICVTRFVQDFFNRGLFPVALCDLKDGAR